MTRKRSTNGNGRHIHKYLMRFRINAFLTEMGTPSSSTTSREMRYFPAVPLIADDFSNVEYKMGENKMKGTNTAPASFQRKVPSWSGFVNNWSGNRSRYKQKVIAHISIYIAIERTRKSPQDLPLSAFTTTPPDLAKSSNQRETLHL